ncbi:MAG: glycosyltransferase family 2 protein [Gammaproteobacteria bacterium]|nr:glycosyltransferase family 2 protein [Gammaproteobacteria bacterium]
MTNDKADKKLSIILPCLNESATLPGLIEKLEARYPGAEIIVVDDGSIPPVPATGSARILRHPKTIGNGAAIKTGVRNATGDYLVFMDADGQHDPADIQRLLQGFEQGFDMVVGARDPDTHASMARRYANLAFNKLASVMTGFQIKDLTSGFRAARARPFRNFLYLLPNGFSYPTTSTMAFFRCGYSVDYVPIRASKREGQSNIKIIKDGVRFLVLILRIGTLFSPMRLFLPVALALFAAGTGWYAYTYLATSRFTNMSAVLYLSSMLTFLFGIVSEQISALHYRYSEERRRHTDRPQQH